MTDDEMTIPQAAELLGIHRSVVLRAVNRGAIEARRLGPRAWVVTRDAVEGYRRSRKWHPRHDPPRTGTNGAGPAGGE